MRLSERIYRTLLRAYPERYRRQYEEPMVQLFRDQMRAAETWLGMARLWMRTIADLVRTVPARHAETSPHLVYGMRHVGRFRYAPWSKPARLAVFFACYEARSFGRTAITTEDLLLGVLREDRDLEELVGGAEAIEEIRREIEARELTPRQESLPQSDLPLDALCRSALALAKEEAQSGAAEATPRHLLAGIVQQEQSLAAQLLRQRGIDLERLRRSE